jgi:hypothetical protein
VRPALAELQQPGRHVRARLAAGIGEAILADLVRAVAARQPTGAGRAAVLSCRDQGIEAVDGSVAMDFLEADGWSVDRLHPATPIPDVRAIAAGGIQLVVAVTAGPRDALALAHVCTALRRLADPPAVVLCDFSERAEPRAATMALGADAVARDPEELVRCAGRQLPASGHRRWGVRLSRVGATLSLAPTGCLDSTSVGRLADVALSRSGSYRRLVLDLRDLAEIDPAGVRHLAGWPNLPGMRDVELVAVAGDELRGVLAAQAALADVRVVGSAEEAAGTTLA